MKEQQLLEEVAALREENSQIRQQLTEICHRLPPPADWSAAGLIAREQQVQRQARLDAGLEALQAFAAIQGLPELSDLTERVAEAARAVANAAVPPTSSTHG